MERNRIKEQSRLGYMDATKYLAMFLVIYSHCIQYCNLDDAKAWSEHPAFVAILSFHMPLFMVISGFFFKSCLKRRFVEMAWKKIRHLLIPVAIWGAISYFQTDSIANYASAVWMFGWFVKCLFLCYVATWILYKVPCLTGGGKLVVFNVLLLVIVTPTIWHFSKMYVFFSMGIFLRNRQYILDSVKVMTISTVLFLALLPFWNFDCSMYKYDSYLLPIHNGMYHTFMINCYRIVLGVAASISILCIMRRIFRNVSPVFSILGSYTLGIYLMQEKAIQYTTFVYRYMATYIPSDLAYLLYAIIVMGSLTGIVMLVSKNSFLKGILFGLK